MLYFHAKIFGETKLSFCMAQSLSSHTLLPFHPPKVQFPARTDLPWLVGDGIAKEAG